MKKIFIILFLVVIMCAMLASCGSDNVAKENDTPKLETAEDYLNALKESGCPIGEIVIWTEETDPNGNLGRPNQYIGKADFADTTLEQDDTNEDLEGGTIEVFAKEEDCTSRYEYLEKFTDPSMGVFGLNQYMYKSDKAILRVTYDITPSEAAIYESNFAEITKNE